MMLHQSARWSIVGDTTMNGCLGHDDQYATDRSNCSMQGI